MRLIFVLLVYTLRWPSAVMIYHEGSIRSFHPGRTSIDANSFGYSITYTPEDKRLIVGAPKANDVGALFSCDIEGRNCSEITTKITAPKDFSIWLGASVSAGSDFFATCAPRYYDEKVDGVLSRCYKYRPKMYKKLMRMKDIRLKTGRPEHDMLTIGWSMDVTSDDDVIAGGPAMDRGHAIMYKFSHNEISEYPPDVISTDRVHANFGYSIIHRIYKKQIEYIISSTYGVDGFGLVFILRNFTSTRPITVIKGKQVGSMFGESLCAAKAGGDSQSMLLVGAPTTAHSQLYDPGAVFLYINHTTTVYREVLGTSNGGQFGYAMANLGDINGDKIDEIAISAPFEDNGRGVVYIYSGAHLLDRDKPAQHLQRIQREEHHHFGFSLHALPDYDQNGCKELAIGAPQSNSAVLLQCIARITVVVEDLTKINVKSNVTAGKASIHFFSCLSFEFPELPKEIDEEILVKVNILNLNIQEVNNIENNTITYTYNLRYIDEDRPKQQCHYLTVNTHIDALNDPTMHYKVSAYLKDDPTKMASFLPSRVTTSDRSVLTRPGVAWVGECKQKNQCRPNLKMKVQISVTGSSYIVGSSDEETLRISVRNEGDPAYKACVMVQLYNITLHSTPKSCMLSSAEGILFCNPIKLLRNRTKWDTDDIKLDTKSIVSSSDAGSQEFTVSVNLYNDCQYGTSIDSWFQNVPLRRNVKGVTVLGVIKHGGVINITRNEIETTSKQIQHEYVINNNGPTTWTNLRLTIALKKEFYLDGISKTSGHSYECQPYEETYKDKDYYISNCKITILKRNNRLEIVLPIAIMPNSYETLKHKQLMVKSNLKLFIDGQEKYHSVVTTLRFLEFKVETWIYVVAVVFSVAIIIIAAFILYECGFLRRKKKEDLRELRKSIRRQSMRRSMVQVRNHDTSDQENLIEVSDDSSPDMGQGSAKSEATAEKLHKRNEIDNQNNDNCSPADEDKNLDVQDSDANGKPANIKERKNDPIGSIIIGGLQKNVGRKEVQPSAENKSTHQDL